ncbi:MAG: cytochrome c [Elusimicrobia bacterium]|nr:cytochrome c [Elusimicrobiota bacterium]
MHRKLFYVFNFLLLASFVAAFAIDFDTEWRDYQKQYFQRTHDYLEGEARRATDPAQKASLERQAKAALREPIQIRQIIARDLKRVDRCVSCHVGMDEYTNPSLVTPFKEHPFTGHPELALHAKSHPFQKFGCTSCHSGQGLATSVKAAHGRIKHWEKPMLEGKLIQASCAKCHQNFETLPGAETVALGRKLFETHGCLGCHSIRGKGGVVSVDLGEIADKPLEQISGHSFSLVKIDGKHLDHEEWNAQNWILAHLTQRPGDFVTNDPYAEFNKEPIAPSGMPDFSPELPEGGARAITSYLLSMTGEQVPVRYAVMAAPKTEPRPAAAPERGKRVFHKYGCQGCHGVNAEAGRANFNAMGPGQADPHKDMWLGREPTLPDVVGTYTREELAKKIQDGVPGSAIAKFNPNGPAPPLYMPAWKDKIKGEELDDLVSYLLSIAKKQEAW